MVKLDPLQSSINSLKDDINFVTLAIKNKAYIRREISLMQELKIAAATHD